MIEVTNDKIDYVDGKMILKFSATWCGPCRALAKTIEEIEKENLLPDYTIFAIDVDSNTELSKQFTIRSVPTMIVLDDKDTIRQVINGAMPKNRIVEMITGTAE